jgi:putative transposase
VRLISVIINNWGQGKNTVVLVFQRGSTMLYSSIYKVVSSWMNIMPRRPRLSPVGIPLHIVQRGNNRQVCFTCDSDLKAYAQWLVEAAQKYKVSIHAWVFMTNHVHLLVTPLEEMAASRMMQFIGRHYVRYFNYTYRRTGTLWEGRFHSCLIQEETFLLNCQRYIELNPVRAGMVKDPGDYSWSSYRINGFGIESKLLTPHRLYEQLGRSKLERLKNYRDLFQDHVDGELLQDIRFALNKGLILGTERFKSEVEALTGRRVAPIRRGPKT